MDPIVTGALVGAGGNLLSNLVGMGNNANVNYKTRAHDRSMQARQQSINESLMDKQHSLNMASWNAQNEYNLPKNQLARLTEAGLNPNLIYGSSSGSASSGSSSQQASGTSGSSVGAPTGSQRAHLPQFDLGIINALLAKEEIKLKQKQQDTESARARAFLADAGLADSNTNLNLQSLDERSQTFALRLEQLGEQVAGQKLQNENTRKEYDQIVANIASIYQGISESAQRIIESDARVTSLIANVALRASELKVSKGHLSVSQRQASVAEADERRRAEAWEGDPGWVTQDGVSGAWGGRADAQARSRYEQARASLIEYSNDKKSADRTHGIVMDYTNAVIKAADVASNFTPHGQLSTESWNRTVSKHEGLTIERGSRTRSSTTRR